MEPQHHNRGVRQQQSRVAPLQEVPPVPRFITEVAGIVSQCYSARLEDGTYLFSGFYSDGRVRLATPAGRRFSGVMIDQRAVIADLREDCSFEMGVGIQVRAQDHVTLEMDGGPFDGQRLVAQRLK